MLSHCSDAGVVPSERAGSFHATAAAQQLGLECGGHSTKTATLRHIVRVSQWAAAEQSRTRTTGGLDGSVSRAEQLNCQGGWFWGMTSV